MRGATVRVAGKVAAVVGTILSLANQGSVLFGGHTTWASWVRVGVNYLTPFVVASIGYLAGLREPPGGSIAPAGRPGRGDRVPLSGVDGEPVQGSDEKGRRERG